MSMMTLMIATNQSTASGREDCSDPVHPLYQHALMLLRIVLCVSGLVLNLGVVLTVTCGKVKQRLKAARVIMSMCVCNMVYISFYLLYAIPVRHFPAYDARWRSTCLQCHFAQIGSNAPKAILAAHQFLIAVDTYWLIKKPFDYVNLTKRYFKSLFAACWLVPILLNGVFDSLTLCFYETLHFCQPRGRGNGPTPEIVNISVNTFIYLAILGVIGYLYLRVFHEAFSRIRHRSNFSTCSVVRRPSLTADSAESCAETYRQEVRLVRGFVVLMTGTLLLGLCRNVYYMMCLVHGCVSRCGGDRWREFAFSALTSLLLLLIVSFSPYAYFYRNPLYAAAARRTLLTRGKARDLKLQDEDTLA